MTRLKFPFLALLLLCAVAACGDDDAGKTGDGGSSPGNGDHPGKAGSSGGSPDGGATADASSGGGAPDAGGGGTSDQSVSVDITAADGGEVVLGDASLSIPGGSLADDTTITLETSAPSSSLPDADTVHGLVYDFGPDGTEFSEPATLTLPAAGKPGADEEAVISWLDTTNDTWQDLTTTVNADGSLSAEVTHFTSFAVRFNGVIASDCAFSACGGDVVGVWTITSVCAEASGPLIDTCPNATATLELTLTGTATFNTDGTRETAFTGKSKITYTLDAACLDTVTMGMPPATCDALDKDADPSMNNGPTTCTGDPAVGCTCVEDNPENTETKTGTYTIEGNTMTSTDDGDGTVTSTDFCISGSDGRFQETEGLAILTYVAKKQ